RTLLGYAYLRRTPRVRIPAANQHRSRSRGRSIEPALAFQALSFIRSGGSFFPPSVLSTYLREVTVNGVDRAGTQRCFSVGIVRGQSGICLRGSAPKHATLLDISQ